MVCESVAIFHPLEATYHSSEFVNQIRKQPVYKYNTVKPAYFEHVGTFQ